jgi:hypothetical protein
MHYPLIRLPNLVSGRSFPPYAVFRKHWRAAYVARPSRLSIRHLKQFTATATYGKREDQIPAPTAAGRGKRIEKTVPASAPVVKLTLPPR